MKKWIALLLMIAMMLSLAACKGGEKEEPQAPETTEAEPVETTTTKEEPTETTEEPTETTEEPTEELTETTEEPTETEIAVEEFWQEEHLVYPLTFAFSSGAGGWMTELYLNEDGSFTGEFRDGEMGDRADAYPNGTVLICKFSGKFAPAQRLDMYTYSTKLVELTTEYTEGEEWIEDGVRYVASYPYGLDGGQDFQIYLPNTPVTMLSEDAYTWWPGRFDAEEASAINAYGLRNLANDQCFFTELVDVEYPMGFYLSSGAGAWGTELYLEQDGSFTGYFHDGEIGTTGEGYPKGTVYVCNFSGRFGQGARLDTYTYSLKLEELTMERPVGEEWIEDEVRYVSSMPVGLEEGGDFVIYLPHTPIENLSEDALFWWPGKYYGDYTTLNGYGLYNLADNSGFFCMTDE